MPKINKQPTHTIEVNENHLRLMAEYIEATHRAICGQYDFLIDLIKQKTGAEITYEEKQVLENIMKSKTHPRLERNASYSGNFDALGYQTYRDILEYFAEQNPSEGFFQSVYHWKQDQIADDPKLRIKQIKNNK